MGDAIFDPTYDDIRRIHFTVWRNTESDISPRLHVQFKCYMGRIEFPKNVEFANVV